MIKTKKIHCVLEFNQSQWLKKYVEFNTEKRIEIEKNGDKVGKVLYKLMNNSMYGKTMVNLRKRFVVKLFFEQQKRLSKMDIRTKLYVTQNISQWFSRDT